MKNKNTKKFLFKFLKAGFFVSVVFLITFLILRTYELKPTTAAPAPIDCSANPSIAEGSEFNSGDDLTLFGNGTCTLTTTATVNSLEIGSVGGDTTVLTHQDNSDTLTNSIDITSTGNITIYSGASINVDELGYDGGLPSSDGYGPGGGTYGSSTDAGGGGYGGDGGIDDEGDSGGESSCDITNPIDLGSGGGRTNYTGVNYDAGSGGGLINLNTSATLTINGTITANGGDAGIWGESGGGSGGGINISADIIAGTPDSIAALGGNTLYGGGGGGGGCVLLEYVTSSTISNVSNIKMYGGSASLDDQYGGAGQLLIHDTDEPSSNGDLFVDNNGTVGADTTQKAATSLTVDSITLDGEANYTVPNGGTLTLSDATPFDDGDATGTLEVTGTLDYTSGTSYDNLDVSLVSGTLDNSLGGTIDITSDGGLIADGSSTITTAMATVTTEGTLSLDYGTSFSITTLNIDSGTTTFNSYTTANALSLTTLDMDGGILTHGDNSTDQKTHVLNISATTIDLSGGGTISADSLGYDGGLPSSDGYGPGGGTYGSSVEAGGGGYGGDGGNDDDGDSGGAGYCDVTNPVDLGSGGGRTNYTGVNYDAGSGGGLINLDVSGTININTATITADGGDVGIWGESGGGSGGGINISADTIAGTPASFTVNGGNSLYGGGGGGGGCILLEYVTSSTISDVSNIEMYGGSTTQDGQGGGAGQLLIHDTDAPSSNGDLFVENNSAEGADTTQKAATSLTVDSITIDKDAVYAIPNGDTLILSDAAPLNGDATGILEVTGSLDYTSGTSYDNLDVSLVSGTLDNSLGGTIDITADGGLIVDSNSTITTALTTLTTEGTLGLEYGASFSITTLNIDSGTTTLNSYTTANALSITTLDMDGGTITHGDNSTDQTHVLNISAMTVDIAVGASINVDELGYDAPAATSDGVGLGGGTYGSADGAAGGGHGGAGGNDDDGDSGGVIYCDVTDPDTIGSSGGRSYSNDVYLPGPGGGLIILNVSGTATINGTITADGGDVGASGYSGGSAGGGIKISANTIAGTPAGFTATGGDTSVHGGGGGGGCVRLEYTTLNSISSGDVTLSGGSNGGGTGQDGNVGLFSSQQLTPSAPTTLYSHSTDASAGDSNPTDITDLTPAFSAICNSASGNCITADIQVDNNTDFLDDGSLLWNGSIDIADIVDSVRSGNITYAGSQLSYNTTYYWRIRYNNALGTGTWSSSTATFYAPRTIELYDFDQGGTVGQGMQVPIQWGSSGGEVDETVNIHYSTDGFGASDEEITASAASTDAPTAIKSYAWTVPNISSATVTLKICSNNDDTGSSATCYTSDNNFTIQANPGSIPTSRNFSNEGIYTADSGITYSGNNAQFAMDDWYNWSYYSAITVDNTGLAQDLTNYQVQISLNNANFDFTHAQSNGEDIRFTSDDETTLIDHWIESYDQGGETATIWVEVPSISASSTETIYIFHGNGSASDTSDIDNTFLFGDDFSSALDDVVKWNTTGSPTVGSGLLSLTTNSADVGIWANNYAMSYNTIMESYVSISAASRSARMAATDTNMRYSDYLTSTYGMAVWYYTDNNIYRESNGGSRTYSSLGTYSANPTDWRRFKVEYLSDSDATFYNDATSASASGDSYVPDSGDSIHPELFSCYGGSFCPGTDGTFQADWILVREYVSTEPPSTVGVETAHTPADTEQKITFQVPHTFLTASDFTATSSDTGEVQYQVSDDDGATWNYCVGDVLTVAADNYAQTNTSAEFTDICFASLSSGGDFNVRSYLHADAGETATLEDMSFTLATSSNTINSAAEKTDGTGTVDLSLELDDLNTTDSLSTKVEYKAGADCSAGTSDPTLDTTGGSFSADSGTPVVDNSDDYQVGSVSVVDVGTNTLDFDWLSATDIPAADGTYCVRTTTHDGMTPSSSADTTLTLDNVDPTASGNLTVGTKNDSSITYTLGAAGSDTNMNQYTVYYKAGASGVTQSDTLSDTIATGAYAPGNTTQTSSLSPNAQYVSNIWTADSYGHIVSGTELASYTHAEIPGQPTISNLTISSFDIVLGSDGNPASTEYAIQVSDGTDFYYIQADGTLGASEVWQTKAIWGTTTVTGLTAGTSYAAHAKARNAENIETAFDGTDSGTTDPEATDDDDDDTDTDDDDTDTSGDTTPPTITNLSPEKGATKISPETTISFNVADVGSGVDVGTLRTTLIGSRSGRHSNSDVLKAFSGDASNFEVTLIPERDFEINEQIRLEVRVRDYADNQTILNDHVFLIRPAQEPTVEDIIEQRREEGLADEDIEIYRAKTSKTEEDIRLEEEQGIVDDGGNLVVADLNYDGPKEIIAAPRAGAPYIRTYSKEGLILVPPYLAYDASYTGGVNIAAGDLHGSGGEQEVITSPMNGSANIRIFNKDGDLLNSFMAREESFRGNSLVKIANLEGPDIDSGELEIIILFSDGILKVFNKEGEEIMPHATTFLPYLQEDNDILFDLEVVDIENNDGAKEILVSDHNTIMIYGKNPETQKIKQIVPDIIPFESGTGDYNKGIVSSVADLDGGGGENEIIVGSKRGSSIVKIFNKDGKRLVHDFYAYDDKYQGGIDLEATDLDGNNGPAEITTVAQNYSAHVMIYNKDGHPLTSGFMAFPEGTNVKTEVQTANLQNDELQGGLQENDIIVTPIQGPTHNRFYSKDSELLTEGFYIVGVGTKVEVEE